MKVQAIYNNKFLKKGLEFASDNGALFVGTTSLVLSTVARPIAIMSTPKTDKENRKYATAKSLASSAIGYGLMLFASLPLAKSVKKINENPSKYLKNETIKALQNGEKSLLKSSKYKFATQLFKLGLGFVIAVPKSILTCAMIPKIMEKMFGLEGKRARRQEGKPVNVARQLGSEAAKLAQTPSPDGEGWDGVISANNSETLQKQQTDTDLFAYSPIRLFAKTKNSPYFTGYSTTLAKGIGKIIDTSAIKNLTEKFHNTNFEMHIMALTDTLATGTFITQTAKSKKIEQDRKKALMYNAGISTGLCIVGSYAVDKLTQKPTDRFIKNFKEANKNSPKLDKYIEGIKIVKPALILGSLYYIAIPLISTFLAEKFDKSDKTNLSNL